MIIDVTGTKQLSHGLEQEPKERQNVVGVNYVYRTRKRTTEVISMKPPVLTNYKNLSKPTISFFSSSQSFCIFNSTHNNI